MLISPGLIRAQNCSEVLIIFARGSGQGQNKPEEQKEAYKFFNEIKDRAPSGITVENKELVYPATGGPMPESYPVWLNAEFPWNAAGTYHLSVSDEISSLTTLLNEQIRDCPNQRFVLGGYSQGANVVGDTLFQLSDEIEQKIAYVALFGDPKFKPDSYAARGDYFAGGHGDGGILEKRKAEFPLQYMGRLTSWCKTSDGICENFIPTAFGPLSKHPTYSDFEIPIAANYAAQELKRHFSGFQTKHIQPGSLGNEVDIVYAVDTTATMQGVLNNLKANLQSLTQQTMALGTDTRVGLTIYNDKANGCSVKEPRTELLLTNDGEQFKNRFSTLSGMCGGSAGDDTYAGLMTAINAQPWRPNARKVVVLLAGNSPNNPDKSMPGTTQATAVNAALAKGIAIHGVVRGDLPSQVSTHKTMIEATGGIPIFMKAGSTSEYMRMYDHIVQLWTQVTNMPSVSINQTRPTQLGEQIQFNAGGTFDPDSSIANYEWDFNNDGIIEMTSDQPAVSYTYSLAYNGVAVVKANSADGSKSVAGIPVSVNDTNPIYRPPSKPRNLKVDFQNNSATAVQRVSRSFAMFGLAQSSGDSTTATVSWEPPLENGNSPIESYVIRGNGEIIGTVPADKTSIVIHDMPEGSTVSVEAVNENGNSDFISNKEPTAF